MACETISHPDSDRTNVQAAFEQGAAAWDDYVRAPLGRFREALILHHIKAQLGRFSGPGQVLDVGAGTGGYALALAQAGYRVTLVDYAPAMLALARRRFAAAGEQVLARADFHCASVDALHSEISAMGFDAVLVHTVLEYLPRPWQTLRNLLTLVKPQGLVSLVIVNQHADVLRMGGAKHDPIGAMHAMQGNARATGLFSVGRQLLSLDDAITTLNREGFEIVAHRGIRIFADQYSPEQLGQADIYPALLDLELAAGDCEPYRSVGRYHQLLGIRSGVPTS